MKNTKIKNSLVCDFCDSDILIEDHLFYESADGTLMCITCGSEHLYIHDYTQHDEYPYVESNEFDGGQYVGLPFRKVYIL